jgi:hypothetical protein
MDKINPELMLAAARMAIPSQKWVIFVMENTAREKTTKIIRRYAGYEKQLHEIEFNPLTNPADRAALGEALEREGWEFFCQNKRYVATNRRLKYDIQQAESPALRYLKCVEAMTGIPMEAK